MAMTFTEWRRERHGRGTRAEYEDYLAELAELARTANKPTRPGNPIRYPDPEVTKLPGRQAMSMGIAWWPATDRTPGHFSIGWSDMTRNQVRAFGRQLLEIAGPEDQED